MSAMESHVPAYEYELAATTQIIEQLRETLNDRGSSLANADSLNPGLDAQTRSIVSETLRALSKENPDDFDVVSIDYADPAALAGHGHLSALHDIDPAEPLMAAEALFGIALPVLVETMGSQNAREATTVARVLHRSIWRRFPPGAIAYVEVLRKHLKNTLVTSRHEVSRELHDRIAHGILAAVRQLESLKFGRTVVDSADIEPVLTVIRDTATEAQSLAFDLRHSAGGRTLNDTLEHYVDAIGSFDPPVTLAQKGIVGALPDIVVDEAFAIVQEAVRNARVHAHGARSILVECSVAADSLTITITDDGVGIGSGPIRENALGLTGMAERAESIGGQLACASTPSGTRVTLTLLLTRPLEGDEP